VLRLGEGEGIAFENQYKLLPRMGCKGQYDLQLVMMEYSGCCARMISTCYSSHSRSNYTLLFTVFRCQWDNGHARQWSAGTIFFFYFYFICLETQDFGLAHITKRSTWPPQTDLFLYHFRPLYRQLWLVKPKQLSSQEGIDTQISVLWFYGTYLVLPLCIIQLKRTSRINFCAHLMPLL
jgi:hypothetical protein